MNPGDDYGQMPPYPPDGGMQNPGVPPENNLVWGILCLVLCCMPLGIVSVVKATQVNTLWAQGDYSGAHMAADEAKKWAIWGAVGGLILSVLAAVGFVIYMMAVAAAVNSTAGY